MRWIFCFGIVIVSFFLLSVSKLVAESSLPVYDTLGGNFTLESTRKEATSLSDFRDKIVLLFFGYTSCPDICPISLATIREALKQLKQDVDSVRAIFISIDPERDSLPHLQEFLGYFHPDFVGMTGSHAELRKVTQQFGVSYHRDTSSQSAGHLIVHSGYVFLIDPESRVRALYRTDTQPKQMVADIQTLLQTN